MAVAIVQEVHIYEFDASVTATFGGAVTASNLLLAWCVNNSANAANAPDGGSWTEVTSSHVTHSVTTNMDGRWYYKTAAGGETSVTLQHTGSTNLGLQVYELSGAGTPGTAVTAESTTDDSVTSPSFTASSGGIAFAGVMQSGQPGSGTSSWAVVDGGGGSVDFIDDVAANARIQAAHYVGTGASIQAGYDSGSTTANKIISAFDVPASGGGGGGGQPTRTRHIQQLLRGMM